LLHAVRNILLFCRYGILSPIDEYQSHIIGSRKMRLYYQACAIWYQVGKRKRQRTMEWGWYQSLAKQEELQVLLCLYAFYGGNDPKTF